MLQMDFTIKIRTDYHIGAGRGLGSQIDSALFRDSDGVPSVRGSTIEGLLRDGLWRLLQLPLLKGYKKCKASGSVEDSAPPYCAYDECPFCLLFGTPSRPKRWRFASSRPVGAEKPLDDSVRWSSGRIGSQTVARVRVNPRMRRAEARKLFKQEEGDRRLEFVFNAVCPVNDATAHNQAALLAAASGMVRRLGSARRRGRGECIIKVINIEGWRGEPLNGDSIHNSLIDWFRKLFIDNQTLVVKPTEAVWKISTSTAKERERYRIVIRVDEPVVVARKAEAGNIFDGLESISGTSLLGAFAEEISLRHDLSDSESEIYKEFVRIIRRGDAQFSPLYPAHFNWRGKEIFPTIPTPHDMLVCKVYRKPDLYHSPAKSYAIESEIDEQCSVCNSDIPLVPLGSFVTVSDQLLPLSPQQREEMHPAVDPRTQRVSTNALFGYVALDSGQYFTGEICCDKSDWETICKLSGILKPEEPFNLRLGKATRRGYGLVTAVVKKIDDSAPDPLRGKLIEDRVQDPSKPITLTLLTDAILVDRWERSFQTLHDIRLIEEFLNDPPESDSTQKFRLHKLINAFCKAGYVDGFNNHLGLPRWRDLALKAGSAVGFQLQPPSDEEERKKWSDDLLERLREIERDGIGLRRNEGFGKVVFNHPVYDGNAGVSGTGFKLDEKMQPLSKLTEATSKRMKDEFDLLEKWFDDLHDEERFCDKLFRNKKWAAVWAAAARMLHESAHRSVDEIKNDLIRFGRFEIQTKAKREPKDFLSEKEIDKIEKAAEQLNDLIRQIEASTQQSDLEYWIASLKKSAEYLKEKKGEDNQDCSGLKRIVDLCGDCSSAFEEVGLDDSINERLEKIKNQLNKISDETKGVFVLIDWLNNASGNPENLRVKLIRLLADRIAAIVRE